MGEGEITSVAVMISGTGRKSVAVAISADKVAAGRQQAAPPSIGAESYAEPSMDNGTMYSSPLSMMGLLKDQAEERRYRKGFRIRKCPAGD